MAMNRKTERTEVGTLVIQNEGNGYGSVYYHIRARSQKHADRIAKALNWYTFSRGVGQAFGDLWYNRERKRLQFHYGMDV
jgi:hypothetical protein